MAVRNVSYDIPPGNHLSCIACDEVLKSVEDAIEHTVVCHKKNRLTTKYRGLDQVAKLKGSVTWTQENVAHLLNVLKKRVRDLGRAKAHYSTCEVGKVHEEITSDLADIIGPGVTHYQVTRKWAILQKRALQFEKLRNKQIKEGLPLSDPPSFQPSVKEIMRCVAEEKIKYLKEMCSSERSYTLKINEKELEIPEELCFDKDDNFEFSEAPDGDLGQLPQSEEGDPGSMVIKRSSVLKIINQIEEGRDYSEIIKEFAVTDSVLSAIEENREAILQGAQRCSLCHILLSTNDDVVGHEIECSGTYKSFKGSIGSLLDKEDPFMGFLPETVDQIVDVVLKWYPKFTKGVNWNKVASHVSCLQSGVTATRCSQKWYSLIGKCRKYSRLDAWAKNNDICHDNPPPDYYSRLIPYADCPWEREPSRENIQRFLCIGPYATSKIKPLTAANIKKRNLEHDGMYEGSESSTLNDDDDDDDDNSYEFEEFKGSVLSTTLEDDLHAIKNKDYNIEETSSTKSSTSKVDIKSASVVGSVTKKKRRSKKRTKNAKHSLDGSDTEAQRIHHVENKLDDVIDLLGDIVKENHRLTKEAEEKQNNTSLQEDIAQKLGKLTRVVVTTHRQNLKQLQIMTKMWERHHEEHQAMMQSFISEISCKKNPEQGVKRKNNEKIF